MITLSKKLRLLFISSSLFLGMQGMDEGIKRNKDANPLEELTEQLKALEVVEGVDLLAKILEEFIGDDKLNASLPEPILLIIPFALKKIEPIYQNLPPSSKKLLADLLNAFTNVINKKITESQDEAEKKILQKFLVNAKPIVEFIQNNSNAGIVAQFSLLDLSGKIIVGASLPLALYGGYKAVQTMMHKDEFQEELR